MWRWLKRRRVATFADLISKEHFRPSQKGGQIRLEQKFREYFWFPPGRPSLAHEPRADGSTASRREAATFEVEGKARAASSAEPSKMMVSSFRRIEIDLLLDNVLRAS